MTPKLKKILIIAIPIAVVVIAAIVVAVLLLGGGEQTYRTVKVYRIDGNAQIEKAQGDQITPYENMLLETDDTAKTFADSRLYLQLDQDKYLMAGPEACFKLSATGSADDSKTRIDLAYGEIVIHVTNPLSANSSFEIGTGNSTMAVRGTSFRIYTTVGQDGMIQTVLQVFEGTVSATLIHPDGSRSEEQSFTAGQSTVIAQNESETYFDKTLEGIDFFELDTATLEFLKVGIEQGKDLGIGEQEIDRIIANKSMTLTVTFVCGENVFATQRVAYGATAKQPALMPTAKGAWNFDFTTPITEDTTVYWVAE